MPASNVPITDIDMYLPVPETSIYIMTQPKITVPKTGFL